MTARPAEDGLSGRRRRIVEGAESEQIRALVASWPDPDEEQLATLALLLCPGTGRDD